MHTRPGLAGRIGLDSLHVCDGSADAARLVRLHEPNLRLQLERWGVLHRPSADEWANRQRQADEVLARQVFAKVIGNAVKQTSDDVRPVINVTGRHDTERRSIVVKVAYNGIGVPAHMRDAVFDGFTRVKTTALSRAGLGLAICAGAMQRHNGTIAITAGPGGTGLTVTMTFPVPPR